MVRVRVRVRLRVRVRVRLVGLVLSIAGHAVVRGHVQPAPAC